MDGLTLSFLRFSLPMCGDEGYWDMGIWGFGDIGIWGYGDMEILGYWDMGI